MSPVHDTALRKHAAFLLASTEPGQRLPLVAAMIAELSLPERGRLIEAALRELHAFVASNRPEKRRDAAACFGMARIGLERLAGLIVRHEHSLSVVAPLPERECP